MIRERKKVLIARESRKIQRTVSSSIPTQLHVFLQLNAIPVQSTLGIFRRFREILRARARARKRLPPSLRRRRRRCRHSTSSLHRATTVVRMGKLRAPRSARLFLLPPSPTNSWLRPAANPKFLARTRTCSRSTLSRQG